MDCIFCKIVAGELPSHKIFEDADVLAFLDIHPVNPGHTLIIPKKHIQDFESAPQEIAQKLIAAAKKVAMAVKQATGSDGFNLSTSNGKAAGQEVMHLHFHIIPRGASDKFEMWHGRSYPAGEAEKVATSIRAML